MIRKRLLVVFPLLLLLLFSCRREEELTVLERLERIPGLTATAITPPSGFTQAFQVDLAQAIDHDAPQRGTFPQRFYLSYRGEDAPTVFYTSGYGISRNYESEPAALLQANQVLMVHRYFPDAVPAADDWSFLTIAQAAADQHEVRSRLAEILPGKWLSSGASKGGMTALYYRYHYPADVAATVAYVAPIMKQADDPRFAAFLGALGTTACCERIRRFQRQVLGRRTAMLALAQAHALDRGYAFTVFSVAEAFEYAVSEYPFAFWQYGSGDCGVIPAESASDQELFNHLVAVSPLSFYADADYSHYRPLFYQAYTEIGYCPYVVDGIRDLLLAVPEPSYRAFAPRGVELAFRPEVMGAVVPWLQQQGTRIVYIYGGNDPWTAAALHPAPGLDALQVVQPGANHNVKIRDLDQRGAVIAALERWLQIDIDETRLAGVAGAEGRERF
jgi:hypothetical protein